MGLASSATPTAPAVTPCPGYVASAVESVVAGDEQLGGDAAQSAWSIARRNLGSLRNPERLGSSTGRTLISATRRRCRLLASWCFHLHTFAETPDLAATDDLPKTETSDLCHEVAFTGEEHARQRMEAAMSAGCGSHVRLPWWLLAGLAMVFAGCAASSPSPTPTTVQVTSSAPTATPLVAAPSPALSPASPSPAPTADEAWDLVFFSDSSLGDVPPLWAERIRDRLGIEVRVHTWPDGPGSVPRDLLDAMENRADVRDAIAGAEVIGIETVPVGTEPGDLLAETCVPSDPTPRDPPPAYSVSDLAEYAGQLRSIFDRIFELRARQPTVIRAMDMYTPVLDQWTAAGIEPACTAGWEAHSGAIRMVADEFGVTTASIYDLFNGAGHHEDPVDKGWIGEDGVHPNAAGTAAQLEFLDSLGYEPVQR